MQSPPAQADQLAAQGRLVVPLSIRGVQQCVAFTRADDHLHSVAVCDCGFMPLTGVMAATDCREPVPGHPDVYVQAAADTEVDIGLVRDALDEPGPATHTGITASALEVLGSLRRWLAFQDRASASLAYTGAQRAPMQVAFPRCSISSTRVEPSDPAPASSALPDSPLSIGQPR
jgi:protein-L-isoaspartate(D-aspartate) O-methyltransferase